MPGRSSPRCVGAGFVVERAGGRRLGPCSTRSTAACTTPGCASSSGTACSCSSGDGAVDGSPADRTSRRGSPPTCRPDRSAPASPTSSRSAPCCRSCASRPGARRAVRRNGDGKVVAAATDPRARWPTEHGSLDGWFVEVDELTGYEKQAAELVELVRAAGVTDDRRRHRGDWRWPQPASTRPASTATRAIPLDPDCRALEGFRLVLGQPRPRPSRPTCRARSTTSTRSSCTTSASPSGAAARCSGTAEGPAPADVLAWAQDGLRELGTVTGPPRDLDVYVLEWDDYVDRPGAGDRGRAAAGAASSSTPTGPPPISELAGRPRASDRVDGAARALVGLARHAARPGDRRSARRPSARRTSSADASRRPRPRLLEHGRAITPATPAEDVHELRKDAKKLRYLLECFGGLLPTTRAQGVRQAAQGAAGQPRRAPGRRGARRPAAPGRRRAAGGDGRRRRTWPSAS